MPVISKHISGKAKLNPVADFQSRHQPSCKAEVCCIEKFINETIDGVIDPGAKNGSINGLSGENVFTNKVAWKKAQDENQACSFAKHLLRTGKPSPQSCWKDSRSLSQ
jgi:hypothetical protein